MAEAQKFVIEIGKVGPETMMQVDPMGFVGVDGKIAERDEAIVFGTDYPEEIGFAMLLCLQNNGGKMGGTYFQPHLTD